MKSLLHALASVIRWSHQHQLHQSDFWVYPNSPNPLQIPHIALKTTPKHPTFLFTIKQPRAVDTSARFLRRFVGKRFNLFVSLWSCELIFNGVEWFEIYQMCYGWRWCDWKDVYAYLLYKQQIPNCEYFFCLNFFDEKIGFLGLNWQLVLRLYIERFAWIFLYECCRNDCWNCRLFFSQCDVIRQVKKFSGECLFLISAYDIFEANFIFFGNNAKFV